VVSKPEIVFTGASWSPDGNRIVYGEGSVALRVLDLASGEDRQIAEGTDLHDPAWSRDGTSIVVVAGNTGFNTGLYQSLGNLGPSRLLLVSARGGALDTLTDSHFMHMSPVWAPDDRGLFLVSNRGGLRDIWFLPLDRHRRPAGEMRRLTTGLRAGSVALSGDGSRLAYGVYAPKTTIWSMSVSATAPLTLAQATRLTTSVQDITQVVVSPDGAWLAFDSDRSGNADIWKMAAAGGEPVQLTTDPGDDFMPDWSPDGKLIAYHSFRDGNRDLTVVSSAGGPARRITATPFHEFNPRWSPDGRRLVFYWRADERREGDRLINTLTRLDDSTWGGIEGVADQGYAPTWSPDGKWIAFAERPNEAELRRGERSLRIRVVPGGGGGARVVQGEFDFEGRRLWVGPAAWGADGKELYFQGYDATGWFGLFSVPLTGGTPRLRLRQDEGELMHLGAPISVNRDRAYFLLRTQESDVYVVDLGRNR
jgi:Tol biopolymer transport system component